MTVGEGGWAFQSSSDISEEISGNVTDLQTAIEDEDVSGARDYMAKIRSQLVSLDKELNEIPVVHDISDPDDEEGE